MKSKKGDVVVIVLIVLVVIISVGVVGLLLVKPTKPISSPTAVQSFVTNENIAKELLEREHGLNSIKSITSLQSAAGYMRGEFDTVPSKEDLEVGRDTGGGGIFLAANIDGIWKLISVGNGQLECKLVKPYNFPDSMVSDCVDF